MINSKTKEIVMYIVFGIITTVIDFMSYSIFREKGISINTSQALAWFLAVLFAYLSNKYFVFCSNNKNQNKEQKIKELFSFLGSRGFSGIISWILMFVFSMFFRESIVTELVYKGVISVIVLVLNYMMSKYFVFKKSKFKIH